MINVQPRAYPFFIAFADSQNELPGSPLDFPRQRKRAADRMDDLALKGSLVGGLNNIPVFVAGVDIDRVHLEGLEDSKFKD